MRSLNDPLAVHRQNKRGRLVYVLLTILLVLPLGTVAWRILAGKYMKPSTLNEE